MEQVKYYIRYNKADEYSAAVVGLTDDELKIVKKFLAAPNIVDGLYAGECSVSDVGYETYEEAARHC